MKKIISFLFLLMTLFVFSQNLTPDKMGVFTIGSKVSEVEKVSKQKIKFTKEQEDGFDYSVLLTIGGIEYNLVFEAIYNDNGKVTGKKLVSVSTSDAKVKTKEGVGVGTSKEDVMKAYPFADMTLNYHLDEDTYTRSRTNCELTLSYIIDSNDKGYYIFLIENNKVAGITLFSSGL